MATSSICNFLSFLIPSKTPPPKNQPPPQFIPPSHSSTSLPAISSHSQPRPNREELVVPLVSQSSSSAELTSVVCPSLAYANTLFFKSAYNVQVIVDENEPEEKLLNRFRREVMRAGVIQECKRRRFFENKQDKEKRKTREAAKRNRRRLGLLVLFSSLFVSRSNLVDISCYLLSKYVCLIVDFFYS